MRTPKSVLYKPYDTTCRILIVTISETLRAMPNANRHGSANTSANKDSIMDGKNGVTKYSIDNKDFWHLTHDGGILSHNVLLYQGYYKSISAENPFADPRGFVTIYGAYAQLSEKEKTWERIRKTEFPDRPTRFNALFLFESKELAENAATEWFGDERRLLVRVRLISDSRRFRADATWLDNVSADNAEDRARHYWEGEMTNNPRPEIIVCGWVYFPDWEQWAKLLTPEALS